MALLPRLFLCISSEIVGNSIEGSSDKSYPSNRNHLEGLNIKQISLEESLRMNLRIHKGDLSKSVLEGKYLYLDYRLRTQFISQCNLIALLLGDTQSQKCPTAALYRGKV